MTHYRLFGKVLFLLLLAAAGWTGCSAKDAEDETVATVDGDPIKVFRSCGSSSASAGA